MDQPVSRSLFLFLLGNLSHYAIFDIVLKITSAAQALLSAFSFPLFSFFANIGKKNLIIVDKIVIKFMFLIFFLYLIGLFIFLFIGDQIAAYFVDEVFIYTFKVSCLLSLSLVLIYSVVEPLIKKIMAFGYVKYILFAKLTQIPMSLLALFFLEMK